VLAWHPKWTREQADRTNNAGRGNLFNALTDKVNAAQAAGNYELAGFVWKQGAADGTREMLANEYYETFMQLVSDVRSDLGEPNLPVFVLSRNAVGGVAMLVRNQRYPLSI
jgi:hypothetical protein